MGVDVTFLAEGDGKSSQVKSCPVTASFGRLTADGWCHQRPAGVCVSHVFQILRLWCLRHNDVVTAHSIELTVIALSRTSGDCVSPMSDNRTALLLILSFCVCFTGATFPKRGQTVTVHYTGNVPS